MPNRKRHQVLYFVVSEAHRKVKIGITEDVGRRMSNLRSHSPDPDLVLLGLIASEEPEALEAELHGKFWRHRSHGEWFHTAPEIMAYIAVNAIGEDAYQLEMGRQLFASMRTALGDDRRARVAARKAGALGI